MNDNKKIEIVVEKRKTIDNSVLAEMRNKYPKFSKNGVAYNLGLTYVTFETDYFESVPVRKVLRKYGAEAVAVIMFFRLQMCQPNGWYCQFDEEGLEFLIEDCAHILRMDEEKVKEIYQFLIDNKVFYLFADEEGQYLTELQQLYNFEILNNHRLRDRTRKNRNQGTDDNGQDEDISTPVQTQNVYDATKESVYTPPTNDAPKNLIDDIPIEDFGFPSDADATDELAEFF